MNVNQIVKGKQAGTFVILGFMTVGGEDCAQVKCVNPKNHAQVSQGEFPLPLSSLSSL
jgi:hypothetical protein